MKAFVNETEVRTYYGAKVKSVVLADCRAMNLPLKLEGIEVRDAYGNIIGLDGSLRANSKIYVKFKNNNWPYFRSHRNSLNKQFGTVLVKL